MSDTVASAPTEPDRDAPTTPGHRLLVAAFMAPALAWAAFLTFGSQLDEEMCGTGAHPHRGLWFGIDVRWVLAAGGLVVLLVMTASAVVLLGKRRSGRADDAGVERFVSELGLLSLVVFVPIVLATLVWLLVEGPC